MNAIIQKQLIINSINVPQELADIIKSFIFYDRVQSRARKYKNILIELLYYTNYEEEEGHVSIRVFYESQFQSVFCNICGGYEFVGDPILYQNIAHSALCCCDGFQEVYNHNIHILNQPLQIYM